MDEKSSRKFCVCDDKEGKKRKIKLVRSQYGNQAPQRRGKCCLATKSFRKKNSEFQWGHLWKVGNYVAEVKVSEMIALRNMLLLFFYDHGKVGPVSTNGQNEWSGPPRASLSFTNRCG